MGVGFKGIVGRLVISYDSSTHYTQLCFDIRIKDSAVGEGRERWRELLGC